MAPDGAVAALDQARSEGLVRFIGVTGHGTYAPEMHLKSLQEYDFASVLTPYNFSMCQNTQYLADLEALISHCEEKGVAVQTIKAVARRRWTDADPSRRFSWYMPLEDPGGTAPGSGLRARAAGAVSQYHQRCGAAAGHLRRGGRAGSRCRVTRKCRPMRIAFGIEPLFIRDQTDDVRVA